MWFETYTMLHVKDGKHHQQSKDGSIETCIELYTAHPLKDHFMTITGRSCKSGMLYSNKVHTES